MAKERHSDPTSLHEIALQTLRKDPEGSETYRLHPKGAELIESSVALFMMSKVSKEALIESLHRAVALCAVLEDRYHSPTTAKALLAALTKHKKVRALLARRESRAAQRSAEYRRFMASELQRAPTVEAEDPDDAVKLKSFLNPGKPLQRNSVSRSVLTPESDGPLSDRPLPVQRPKRTGAPIIPRGPKA